MAVYGSASPRLMKDFKGIWHVLKCVDSEEGTLENTAISPHGSLPVGMNAADLALHESAPTSYSTKSNKPSAPRRQLPAIFLKRWVGLNRHYRHYCVNKFANRHFEVMSNFDDM